MKRLLYLVIYFGMLCNNAIAQQIVAAEYFIDNDPGVGNGTPISIIAGDSVEITASIAPASGLKHGFHVLLTRFKNSNGTWGAVQGRSFFFDSTYNPLTPQLARAEYYIDTDPGIGQATPLNFTSADSIDIITGISLSGFAVGKHKIGIRMADADGRWSYLAIDSFRHCDIDFPTAGFNRVTDNNNVSFQNTSANGTNYAWSFGDGQSSTIASPFHTYAPGNYTACVRVSNNCWATEDTFCNQIVIAGISSFAPVKGTTNEGVTIEVKGGGFVAPTRFALKRSAHADVAAIVSIADSGLFHAALNLSGVNPGLWDVEIITPFDTFLFTGGFRVLPPPPPDFNNFSVAMNGSWVLRLGFDQVYSAVIRNNGQSDANGVPLEISGLPPHSQIRFQNEVGSMNEYAAINALGKNWDAQPFVFLDSCSNTSYTHIILPHIPANEVATVQFIIKPPASTALHTYYNIRAAVGQSLVPNIDTMISPATNDCMDGEGGAIELAASNFISDSDMPAFLNCGYGLTQRIIAYFSHKDKNAKIPSTRILKTSQIFSSRLALSKDCADTAMSTAFLEANIPAMVSRTIAILNAIHANAKFCSPKPANTAALITKAQAVLPVIIGNAVDPNEKYGPTGGSHAHYVVDDMFAYTIGFENDTNANLPAQTVRVYDTLDKSKFDLSTFRFTSVAVGDSNAAIRNGTGSFIREFNLSASMGVKVRIAGSLDTATGIASWVFNSINPATNQIDTRALTGFLPPDTASPRGQGYVSFIVSPKAGRSSGDTIRNKAAIYFDFNAPIHTGNWTNVVDVTKPHSSVQPLCPVSINDSFKVSWSGTDTVSGIRSYSVYVSRNLGPWELWLQNYEDTSAYFEGLKDSTYYFYSIAADSAGNEEVPPSSHQAFTQINIPRISIAASPAGPHCANIPVTFTATVTNGNSSNQFQWKRNGVNAGTNSPVYIDSSLTNGDSIYCVYSVSATACSSPQSSTLNSNVLRDSISSVVVPAVSISASPGTAICQGTSVTFTATATNGGASPTFQWRKNGVPVASSSAIYTSSTLSHSDTISCELLSSENCAFPATAMSGTLVMGVTPLVTPAISVIASDTSVCIGSTVDFTAAPTHGGTSPAYQWKVNGSNMGIDSNAYGYSPANGDTVYCILTSSDPCVTAVSDTSNYVVVTTLPLLTPSVSISASPGSKVCAGTVITFTATTGNAGTTPAYQWQVNGIIQGGNSGSYSTGVLLDGDIVRCVLTTSLECYTQSTDTNELAISVLQLPKPEISRDGGLLMSGISNAVYSWYLLGVLVPFATSEDYTPVVNGSYTVVVTDSNGCTGISLPFEMGSVGVSIVPVPEDVNYYPNPAKQTVFVSAKHPVNISVFGPEGKELLKQSNTRQISVESLPDGLYMLVIRSSDGRILKVGKLMKSSD